MSTVGGVTLPLVAGEPQEPLADSAVTGLLDFIGWWLRHDLNAKLATLDGKSQDAAPVANRFPYDPGDTFVRESVPALYLWWPGKSRTVRDTMVYDRRERELTLLYVYDEHTMPGGMKARAGLLNAVDASLTAAFKKGWHPEYAPPGGSLGQRIDYALSLLRVDYTGATQGEFKAAMPSGTGPRGGRQQGTGQAHVQHGFPALSAKIDIWERVAFDDDTTGTADADFVMTIDTNEQGNINDTLTILERKMSVDSPADQ